MVDQNNDNDYESIGGIENDAPEDCDGNLELEDEIVEIEDEGSYEYRPSPLAIELPRSKIKFENDCFIKIDEKGKTNCQIDLIDIRSVSVRTETNSSGLLISLSSIALAGVSYWKIPIELLSWALLIVLGGIGLIGLFDYKKPILMLECTGGLVEYATQEDFQHANAFAVTLNSRIVDRNKQMNINPSDTSE